MFGGRYFGARYFGRRYFGKAGLTLPGIFFGGRYFGARYFGHRYWGANAGPASTFEVAQTSALALTGTVAIGSTALVVGSAFNVVQSGALALSGTLGLSGSPVFVAGEEWFVAPPLELAELAGTLLISGDISITDGGPPVLGGYWGRRYFGGRYFGGRYFGRPGGLVLQQTGPLVLSGTVGVAGALTTAIGIDPGPLALVGTIGVDPSELILDVPDATAVIGGRRRSPTRTGSDDDYANRVREHWAEIERVRDADRARQAVPIPAVPVPQAPTVPQPAVSTLPAVGAPGFGGGVVDPAAPPTAEAQRPLTPEEQLLLLIVLDVTSTAR
ncbi:MAG: hypothetical protein HY855_03455 [Burkholderiales bacterium]|nr:hypothetical protein [Burkholderiales bacterium]